MTGDNMTDFKIIDFDTSKIITLSLDIDEDNKVIIDKKTYIAYTYQGETYYLPKNIVASYSDEYVWGKLINIINDDKNGKEIK